MRITKKILCALLLIFCGYCYGFYKSTPYKNFLIKYYIDRTNYEYSQKEYEHKLRVSYEEDFERIAKALFNNNRY